MVQGSDDSSGASSKAPIEKMCEYRSLDTIYEELIGTESQSPKYTSPNDNGTVRLLVQRPNENERAIVREAHFSVSNGMEGSGWALKPKKGYSNQICVMSIQAIRAITNSEDENIWAAAGDQIFMDFDLSKENLKVDDHIIVGHSSNGVILKVSQEPHNGCAKFSKRYGIDALKIVNCPQGKKNRLRGIYFIVVRQGIIHQGDSISKIPKPSSSSTHQN